MIQRLKLQLDPGTTYWNATPDSQPLPISTLAGRIKD